MSKISVVFWTQGGNTESMANAIVEGIKEAGKEAEAVFVSDMNIDELKGEGVFALGCPAMGAEVLEESEMEPFVADVEGFASGKKIGLFGSYGWGDGQWMRDWEARMSGAGATIVEGKVSSVRRLRMQMQWNSARHLGKHLQTLNNGEILCAGT